MNARGLKRLLHGASLSALGLGLLLAWPIRAQVLEGSAKKGVHAQYNPKTGKPEWVATYQSASPLANDNELIQELQLVLFNSDGRSNLVVTTPQCVFDLRNKVISSTETLQTRSVSGEFSLAGEGFECRLPDERLVISNRVHAVIRRDWLSDPTKPPPPRSVPPSAQTDSPGDSSGLLHIFSDQLHYQTNHALFEGNVRADEPQGSLSSGRLTATLVEPNQRLENLLAEDHVAIISENLRAASQRANYQVTNDLVELSGAPTWRLGTYEGRGDILTLNRRTREFHAARNVELLLPANALGTNGIFGVDTSVATNSSAASKQLIRVNAQDLVFRPDKTDTNLNVVMLRGQVQVASDKGDLSSEFLTIKSSTDQNRTESIVAERQVVMKQGDNLVRGEKAVYTSTNELMEVTDGPAWKIGPGEGTAQILVFDMKHRAYRAMRDVRMRFPAASFGSSPWLSPKAVGRTNVLAAAAPTDPTPNDKGNPVEISADEFELAPDRANTNWNVATYRGRVLVTDPERMRLSCERLTGKIPNGTNQMESVVAERSVDLEIHGAQRDGRAQGDRAVYTASTGEVVLTSGEGVEITFRDPKIEGKGKASSAIYAGQTDVLQLTGNPVLSTQYGQASGDVVILDHINTTLTAGGHWKLQLSSEALNKAMKSAPQAALTQPAGSRPADREARPQ